MRSDSVMNVLIDWKIELIVHVLWRSTCSLLQSLVIFPPSSRILQFCASSQSLRHCSDHSRCEAGLKQAVKVLSIRYGPKPGTGETTATRRNNGPICQRLLPGLLSDSICSFGRSKSARISIKPWISEYRNAIFPDSFPHFIHIRISLQRQSNLKKPPIQHITTYLPTLIIPAGQLGDPFKTKMPKCKNIQQLVFAGRHRPNY